MAETLNGILKQEFIVDNYRQDLETMKTIIKETIEIYNNQIPHYSNYILTPQQLHTQNEIQMRTCKTKISSKYDLTGV